MLSFLNPYLAYVKLAGLAALAVFAAWAFRVNHLRSVHEAQLAKIAVAMKSAGYPRDGYDDLASDVNLLSAASNTYKQNWTVADAAVSQQNDKIQELGKQADAAKAAGEAAEQKAQAAIADRDQWIAKAQSLSTRTTPMSDSQELQECTAVMNDLYSEGF